MNTQELKELLLTIVADQRLQKAEKNTLKSWLEQHCTTDQQRGVARSLVFQVAQEQVTSGNPKDIIDWLEDVNKLLLPQLGNDSQEDAFACFSPGMACIQEILRQIQLARTSIDVCVFTITDDRISDALIQAHSRGIKVRVITDNDKSEDQGSDIVRLVRAGIPCIMDETEAHMHHKYAIFDDVRLLSGSFNWTRSATEYNNENLIVTPDSKLVKEFRSNFEKLWKQLG
ncbi:MAG: phospholipase D-like domain-containing protein [Zavarzinella sp.]